jgi:predicted esterase YcpF (UPF0227 family)
MTRITHVLYLHGFRSSPGSSKARFLQHWFANEYPHIQWECPQLPASALASAHIVSQLLQTWSSAHNLVIGSSLGGFYASWAAAKFSCAVCLLNPAVHPARDLASFIGIHPSWHDPDILVEIKPEHLEELKALYVSRALNFLPANEVTAGHIKHDASPLLAMIATGDEVLDWQEMSARYPANQQYIIPGSDHGITDFADHVHVLKSFINDMN